MLLLPDTDRRLRIVTATGGQGDQINAVSTYRGLANVRSHSMLPGDVTASGTVTAPPNHRTPCTAASRTWPAARSGTTSRWWIQALTARLIMRDFCNDDYREIAYGRQTFERL